jgi:hypothetical protein
LQIRELNEFYFVFRCEISRCTYFAKSQTGLDSHQKREHSNNKTLEDGVGRICEDCGAHFGSLKPLRVHIRHHHKQFKCNHLNCTVQVIGANALERHKRNQHPSQNLCPICGGEFTTQHYLRHDYYSIWFNFTAAPSSNNWAAIVG